MEIFKELHERMDAFAENIAKEVAEKRFYEIAEVKAIAKTRLWFAIYDCLQLQVTDKEKELRKLVEEYGKAKGNRIQLGTVIAKVTSEKKDANRLMHTMQDYNEYEQLKKYVKEKCGENIFMDFVNNYLEKPENRKRKPYINAGSNAV